MNEQPAGASEPNPDEHLSELGRAMMGSGSVPGSGRPAPWVPPSPEELQALLPQYQILSMLGRGGMGAVYMGRQLSLDRPVAIKILSGALEDQDLGFKERFKNEARAMARLNHPGIVSVYDSGETSDGLLFIVMEYVDGTDVARMIASEGRLHTEHAMAITAHVCDALAYAHSEGIIHRDIKPANIMVGYNGAVKVADFGLAKVHSPEGNSLGLTMSGMAMGTMHYIAPEALLDGPPVDHRADLYAVGVMLYQMLTGRLPQGMFTMPSLQVPGLDPRYDAIIARAMMQEPGERYQGAQEFRAALDHILTQPVEKAEPAQGAAPARVPLLPSEVRPKRPGARRVAEMPSREMHKVPGQPSRKPLWPWLVGAAAVIGTGAYFYLTRTQPETGPTLPVAAADPTASTPTVPDKPIAPNTPAPAPSTPASVATTTTTPAATPPASPSNALTNLEEDGWVSLFNGTDLTGWQPFPDNMPVTVENGMIRIKGVTTRAEGGHLFHVGTGNLDGGYPDWKDFEAIVTVKTSKHGNSGFKFHSRPKKSETGLNVNGIEVNLWNEGMIAPMDRDHRTGSAFGIAPVAISHFNDEEWFSVRILVEGKRLRTWVKKIGAPDWTPTVDWTEPDNWTPPSNIPNARLSSGTIAFTNWVPEEGEVWIKEVKIKLPEGETDPQALPSFSNSVTTEPQSLEDALLNYLWEWTHEPHPSDTLSFNSDGTATCPRFSWHWKITGPQSVLAFDSTESNGMRSRQFNVTLNFDSEFKTLTGDMGKLHYTGRRLGLKSSGGSASDNGSTNQNTTASPIGTYNGSRYQFVPGSLTWVDAKAKAESMGGHLAAIATKGENDWIISTYGPLLKVTHGNIWLGGIEESAASGWNWVTEEAFTPVGWVENEPNGLKGGGGSVGHPFMLNLYRFPGGLIGWNDSSTHESQVRNNIGFLVEWSAESTTAKSVPTGESLGEESLIGVWKRTSVQLTGVTAGKDVLMELHPKNTAHWVIDGERKTGSWSFLNTKTIEVRYEGGGSYELTLSADSTPLVLTGKRPASVGPGDARYERISDLPATTDTAASQWTDTKGRNLVADFVRLEGETVVLNIRGNETPVPLASLSSASQQQARALGATNHAGAGDGFSPLFPNDSLSGWTGDIAAYRIGDGILTSTERGDLISPKDYANFVLRFDLRLGSGSNSGVGIWREAETGATATAARGFEVQILDDTSPKFQSVERWQRHGGIFYFKEPVMVAMNQVGSWNSHEITVDGDRVKVVINGKLAQDADVTQLRPLVSRAPVLDISRRSGRIVLLGHTGIVEFRNLEIKELP